MIEKNVEKKFNDEKMRIKPLECDLRWGKEYAVQLFPQPLFRCVCIKMNLFHLEFESLDHSS